MGVDAVAVVGTDKAALDRAIEGLKLPFYLGSCTCRREQP